jgi:20S proteasome alpha/beta subunit
MTIAIGIRCSDGIIIAADREEGDGYMKNDVGKIRATVRLKSPIGQIAIAGAGSGPYIDEVSKILTDEFAEENSGLDEITNKHRNYYSEIVMPMSVYGANAPDYRLLIGSVGGNVSKGIYSTAGLSIKENDDYEAIGAGAMIANEWLSRLWDYVPVLQAAKLAAYVIFHVKNSIPGCGHGTDIMMLNQNAMPARILPAGVRKWEETFRTTYRRLDRNVFYHTVGLDVDPQFLMRTQLGKEAIDKNLEDVKREITPLDSEITENNQ